MKRNNEKKKKIYENIMKKVSNVVKKTLNEEFDEHCEDDEHNCSDIPDFVDCNLYNDVCKYMDVVEFKKISNDIIAVTEDYGDVKIYVKNKYCIFDFQTEESAFAFVENFKWEGTPDIDAENYTRVFVLFG